MKTKFKKSITISLALIICCVCIFGILSNSTIITFAAETQEINDGDNEEQKIYSNATLEDNFVDDTVLVVMADRENENASESIASVSMEYDFSDIGCYAVEELTKLSTEIIEAQKAVSSESINSTDMGIAADETRVDEDDFKKILSLKLEQHGKTNVLSAIDTLEKRSDILYAGPDYIYELETENVSLNSSDPRVSEQWAINKIGLPTMWNKTTGSNDVKVGVLDTGIDSSHPELSNNVNRILSRDFTGSDTLIVTTPTDLNGHGTHVAGIIAADGNDGNGIAGVCWDVDIISLRVFDAGGSGTTSSVTRAVDFAASNNIDILNYSGGGYGNDGALRQAIDNYSGLFVCAAGNDGLNTDSQPHYPSAHNDLNNLISVGASTSGDKRATQADGWSKGSNYGKNSVDLFAPGDKILSTYPVNKGSYATLSGTSMATPYVTGVAALILSQYPDMSSGVLKANILEGVKTLSALNNLCVTGGRLNAASELKVLNTSIVSKSNGVWTIKVTNPTDSAVDVVYNTKMCNGNDAKNWEGLVNIETFNLVAHGSKTVTVSENVFATHIAFSYIEGSTRYITYSDQLNTNGTLSSYFAKSTAHDYNGLSIIGKDGNTWLIKITNIYPQRRKIEYNLKMCFPGNASGWTDALTDLKSFYLNSGDSKVVEITENAFATTIAVSYIYGTSRAIKYADNLNANTTMSVYGNNIMPVYLRLENVGSGWKIKITNPSTQGLTVYYNSKMCNFNDAKNWTGLKDVNEDGVYIGPGSSKTVTITSNWFATSVTVSYVINGKRYISYANGLNGGGGISVNYNTVNA